MKKIWKYLITALCAAAIVILILLVRGTFTSKSATQVYGDLCDAFFVPGAVLVCLGLLVFATNGGAFDMLSFGFRKLFDSFKRDVTNVKYRTFYDYHQAKKDKKRSFMYVVLVGVAYILVAVVFLVLYQKSM